MRKETQDWLTDQHLILFGRIIQWFARHEVLMQEIMATVSGADATSIKLMTNTLSFAEKRDALLNLLHHRAVQIGRIDRIREHLEVPHTFTALRDDIAHSMWIEGKPENLISPAWLTDGPLTAIKPLHDIGGNTQPFIEGYEDKVTYTLDELREIYENLKNNYVRFHEYSDEIGFVSSSAL
jgi:hypothetical protein